MPRRRRRRPFPISASAGPAERPPDLPAYKVDLAEQIYESYQSAAPPDRPAPAPLSDLQAQVLHHRRPAGGAPRDDH